MKKVELDIGNIHTVRALHVYLAYKLNLPTYYGGNLDALYDALATWPSRRTSYFAARPPAMKWRLICPD